MKCPNKNHPDWKELVNKLGENNAYLEYERNNLEIPNPSNFIELENKQGQSLEELFPEFVVREGIEELFNENPELANIGTRLQYSQYLDTIFPDSQEDRILVHTSHATNIEKFEKRPNKNFLGFAQLGKGVYLTDLYHLDYWRHELELENGEGKNYYVKVNLQNTVGVNNFLTKEKEESLSETIDAVYENRKPHEEENNWKPIQYAVRNPEQIHILGSKQDIQGFREFVNNPSTIRTSVNNTNKTEYEKEKDNNIKQAIKNFLEVNGISYEVVENLTDSNGNPLPANAVADMMAKAVRVLQGYESVEILGEEAAHFLVELLGEDHPLYRSMMSEIEGYEIYQEIVDRYGHLPGYKGNKNKLKKEAVGHLIARMIAGTFEDASKQARAERWWNKVLRYLKERVNSLVGREVFENAVVDFNPFSQASEMILSGQTLSDLGVNISEGIYYSESTATQESIVNDIRNKHKISSLSDHEGYEREVSGEKVKVKNRVTDRVARWAAKKFTKSRTETQKVIDDIKAKYGTAGHQDINNIILRAIAKRDGTVAPSRESSLPDEIYDTLEEHFRKFIDEIPSSSVILSEVTLYDTKADEAGTIDLLVVDENGKVDIFDWKFIDFGSKKEIAFFKRQGWEIQLPRYREILRTEYGITDFGKMRVIPISAVYKGKDLRKIQIGDTNTKAIPKDLEHLLPVPMFEEMTGIESLDRLLQSLLKEKAEIENKRAPSNSTPEQVDAFAAARVIDLKRIQKAIADIQRDHDITEYVERGLDLLRTLKSTDIKSMPLEDLLDLVEIKLKRYGHETIGLISVLGEDVLTEELKDKLSSLVASAQDFEGRFTPELGARIAELAGREAMDPRKEKSWWGRNIQTISRQDDPIIQSFFNLVKRSKEKTRKALDKIKEEIESAIADLVKDNPNAGSDLYSFMIKEKPNGELATVDKFSQEFYTKLEKQREIIKDSGTTKEQKREAAKWIRENTEFNEEAYKKGLETFTLFMERAYKDYREKDYLIHERLEDYKNSYSNNMQALANSNNRNLKIKENSSNYSEEFRSISSNPAKLKFYNLWMERNTEFIQYTGVNRRGSFIWNIPNNLIERVTQSGLSGIVDSAAMTEQFLMREGDTLGMTDPDTGKPLMKIPVYYSTLNSTVDADGNVVINNRNQSRNLGQVLLQVGAMAYNHKHMSDIESNSQLLRYAIGTRETLSVAKDGGVLRNKHTNALDKAYKSSNDLAQFEDYLNYYIYGVTLKSTDREIKIGDKSYSKNAGLLWLQRWFTGKALAFNPVSITANAIGGNYMAMMTGASGRLFNNVDYNKAVSWDLPTRDATSYSLIGIADLLDRDDFKRKIRKSTSYNFLTKELTYDNLFLGQRGGDWWIRNATLVAMSKKYKVEDGQIKRLGSEESTSLYNYIKENTKDGKVALEKLKEGELEKFINAVQHTTEIILGNSSRDDINTLRLTIAGRAVSMFRSWIPATYEARFGALKYNDELDMHNKGRYMTFFETIWNKKVHQLGWDMIKSFGVLGFGGTVGNSMKQHAEMLWRQEMEKNPNINMTKEEYLEMHVGNLRSMMAEIYIYASIVGIMMLARGDDDETLEAGSFRKYAYEQLDRIKMEVATFWHPTEFYQMMRSPVPMLNIWNDFGRIGYLMFGVPYKYMKGEQDEIVVSKARRAVTGNIPVLSGMEKMWYFIDSNYEKAIKNME